MLSGSCGTRDEPYIPPPGRRLFIYGRPDRLKIPCPDASKVRRVFRMDGVSESVSRNLPLEWDAVSRWRPWGKCIPEMGCELR